MAKLNFLRVAFCKKGVLLLASWSKLYISLIRSQNTGQLNVALYIIKHYSSTSSQDIIIPKRIRRGPTDILKVRGITL